MSKHYYSTFSRLYKKQIAFQHLLGNKNIPRDDPQVMSQHLFGLVGEVGEVAQADQRWKTNGRNTHYNREEKLEEIADCLIYLLNVCIYSDISAEELQLAAYKKLVKNAERYKAKEKSDGDSGI